jgi:hypothetical protein
LAGTPDPYFFVLFTAGCSKVTDAQKLRGGTLIVFGEIITQRLPSVSCYVK